LKTEQSEFWRGSFGDQYTDRNSDQSIISSNMNLFEKIIESTGFLESILEFGCNRGLNLLAIRQLMPKAELSGVDVNAKALQNLNQVDNRVVTMEGTIESFVSENMFDLVFTKGVLIHIHPDNLALAYSQIEKYSRRYVLLAEYFNPTPVEVEYRGHTGKLFKRDFAAELMSLYPSLTLVDYGFRYHLDPIYPLDNISWFLLEKR
tara:strand:- start:1207 stop:1821 length:615 start_codon:yes stop_codon:yes gene_type:complete